MNIWFATRMTGRHLRTARIRRTIFHRHRDALNERMDDAAALLQAAPAAIMQQWRV